MATIFDYKALASNGKEIDFKEFEGKVLLIVTNARKCGFPPQFDALDALTEKYRDRGLVVIGFPCNQFNEQDPGSDSEIQSFCRVNYGVTFQIMKKIDVNGPDEHPIFAWLKEQAPTEEYSGLKAKATHVMLKKLSKSVEKDSDILWNFTKFLISRDGTKVLRYAPTIDPKDFEKDIEGML
jgi:glutathione peroxidase